MQIILASGSPRRAELLGKLDIPFIVKTKSVDESFPKDLASEEVAEYLACKKANAFNVDTGEIVITADTTVLFNDEVLGKPTTREEAYTMLQKLSGSSHQVVTGVCIKSSTKLISFNDVTLVVFDELNDEEIGYYISKYEPFDKAGSYGIQEWIGMIGIERIEGCYFNVMGLPVKKVYKHLKEYR